MSKASVVHSRTLDPSLGGIESFGPFGHELMHPAAYLDRLAFTKQVPDVQKVSRGSFPLILLTLLSVSA